MFLVILLSLVSCLAPVGAMLPNDFSCSLQDARHGRNINYFNYTEHIKYKNTDKEYKKQKIHLICFGNLNINAIQEWSEFCEENRYEYDIWTVDSLKSIKRFSDPLSYLYLEHCLKYERYKLATDVLKEEIQTHYGGIVVVDVEYPPWLVYL